MCKCPIFYFLLFIPFEILVNPMQFHYFEFYWAWSVNLVSKLNLIGQHKIPAVKLSQFETLVPVFPHALHYTLNFCSYYDNVLRCISHAQWTLLFSINKHTNRQQWKYSGNWKSCITPQNIGFKIKSFYLDVAPLIYFQITVEHL